MTLHDRRRTNVSQGVSQPGTSLRPLKAQATKFLSVKEVAMVMHVSVATVWRYAQRGTLPTPIKIDGHTWWIKGEVLAVIEEKIASRQMPAPQRLVAQVGKKRARNWLQNA